MSESVSVGIDWSEPNPRVSYSTAEQIFDLPPRDFDGGKAILFDPEANISGLGVGFPSLLPGLGRADRVYSVFRAALQGIKSDLIQVADRPLGPLGLAVPASLSQANRKLVLRCVAEVGFESPSLIDPCGAAGLSSQALSTDSRTMLIVHLGYNRCEFSLVRLARGRLQVVGADVVKSVSGEMLEARILESIVHALRKERIFLGLREFDAVDWLNLRQRAEVVRLTLSRRPDVAIELPNGCRVALHARGYERLASALVEQVTESVTNLLELKQVDLSNVDEVMLAGELATASPFAETLAQAFGKPSMRMRANAVSVGAALHARSMAGLSWPATIDQALVAIGRPATGGIATAPSNSSDSGEEGFVTVIRPPRDRSPVVSRQRDARRASEASSLQAIRALLEDGRYDEARAALDQVVSEIDELRKKLNDGAPGVSHLLIQQAQAMLAEGQYAEAVGLAHRAYRDEPTDPHVFTSMIKIHTDAGSRLSRPEEYSAALKFLDCAYSHDQTDRSVHKAIAERHFVHAQAMLRLNNPSRAFQLARQSLSFDPKHEGANALIEKLSGESALAE